MITGNILCYSHPKGIGIIKGENKEFFLHKSQIKKAPKVISENDFVKFEKEFMNKKLCAINCVIISSQIKKVKNTTDFKPNMNEGDLHIVFRNGRCPCAGHFSGAGLGRSP